MVLPRPSNTGILISAVLVGLLGLGANWFMKLDPAIFQSSVQAQEEENEDSTSYLEMIFGKEEEPIEVVPPPNDGLPGLEQCLTDLNSMREKIEKEFNQWEKGMAPMEVGAKFTSRAEKLCQLVVLDPNATDDQRRTARLTSLAILFRAARMVPDKHHAAFRRACKEVQKGKNPHDNSRVVALRIFLECNFSSPDRKRLLVELGRFSDHCSSNQVAVGVYLSIAKELKRYRQYAVAQDVLRLGLSKHKGKASNRLFNELHKRTIPTSHRVR